MPNRVRTLSGAIAQDELLLEQQGFCSDGAHATWSEQFCDSYEQVNYEKKQIAHEMHVITCDDLRKTARGGPVRL